MEPERGKEEGEEMRFIAYWESDPTPENFKKSAEAQQKLNEERKKFPEKYPRVLFGNHVISMGESFTIYEADNEEQLLNLAMLFLPIRVKFVAIFRVGKVREFYQKSMQ